MMEDEINENRAKLKQDLVKVLKYAEAICMATAVVNPIPGVIGSLIRVVRCQVDDEDIRTLSHEFGLVHGALDQLSQQTHNFPKEIKKVTLDCRYWQLEGSLKDQWRMFKEMAEAPPEHRKSKKDDFLKYYVKSKEDQHLYTLYNNVMGTEMVFSQPILEMYLNYSQGDRRTMDHLCTRLSYLFCIGLAAYVGYLAVDADANPDTPDDTEGLIKGWVENMEHVQKKMEEALHRCK